MSIDPAAPATANALPNWLSGTAPLLRFQGGGVLERSLSLGQVVEGRVTRAFQGGRYLMEFNGKEQVVDSAVPLQQGDVLRGRVVALGEQVVLEKMATASPGQTTEKTADAPIPAWLMRLDDPQALRIYHLHADAMDAAQWRSLAQLASNHGAERAILSALTVHKIGLSQHAVAMQALAHALAGKPLLNRHRQSLMASVGIPGAVLASWTQRVGSDASLLTQTVERELGASREALLGAPAGDTAQDHNGEADREAGSSWAALAKHLLNVQPAGAMAHRMMTLPLCIDGRLVEFRIALFDESDQAELQPQLKQRTLRIALDLDSLGKVELTARAVDHHISIDLLAGSAYGAETLGSYNARLDGALAALGWTVDGVRYGVAPHSEDDPVVRSVMERVVAGGSFRMVA